MHLVWFMVGLDRALWFNPWLVRPLPLNQEGCSEASEASTGLAVWSLGEPRQQAAAKGREVLLL